MTKYTLIFPEIIHRIIVLLVPLLVASCGTWTEPDSAQPSERCYQMHGSRTVENGEDNISIYLGTVKSKVGHSWESSPYHPFEISDTEFWPWVGYASGFEFSVHEVKEVIVSINGAAPVHYKRLKLEHPDFKQFTLEPKEEFWVPPSFPRRGFRVPELPQGDYRVEVRYRANGKELHAHWHITYRPAGDYKAPLPPACCNGCLVNPPASKKGRSEQDETQQPLSAALFT